MKSSASSGMNLTSEVRFAAIYARVPTEDQGKGFSIPTQIDACQQLATREGYIVPESHVLRDEGISGTTLDRPGLHQLRELVQAHAIAAVIAIDPDRLSRNLGHQLLLAEELEQAGVKLVIVSHPLERGPEGWLFFQMRGALAEYERAKLLERTHRGRIGRAKAGHPWGQVPFGYRAIREPHGGRWEVEPEEAAIVRRMFAMCLQGLSTREIARQLTMERVPTAAEVAQYEATTGERRAALVEEIEVIEAGLATCDREAQRWAEAYAAEVISLFELKEYRREIASRRQQLQVRHAGVQAELETIGQTSGQLESVMNYCSMVRQRLQTFNEHEKRLALEALDIHVTWTPNEPLAIQGSIPLSDIVPVPSECRGLPRALRRRLPHCRDRRRRRTSRRAWP
jgi:DNA invertase Pin-like site-specific DNA recombinase